LRSFELWANRISNALAFLAASLLFGAILVITWMVAIRAFGFQNYWELETSITMMVAAVFLGSPYTLASNGHVAMSLLSETLSARGRMLVGLMGQLIGLAVCIYLTMLGFELTLNTYLSGERVLGFYQPRLWPTYLSLPVGMAATSLQYVVKIRQTLVSLSWIDGSHD
jgi:TRAP-type C4-dicarboxylate transport system permease small subunit